LGGGNASHQSGALDPLGLFPDNSFRPGGLQNLSVLSEEQQRLLGPLADYISREFSTPNAAQDSLTSALMNSNSSEARATSERIFREALLGPSMRAFNEDVAPAIAGDFANVGGTLSSKRGQALAKGRTDVLNQSTASLAGILPQIQAFPLQQTLAQIQGLGAVQQQRYAPFQNALQFALSPTRQNIDESAGPGWGVLQSVIGAI
jgi:hypothetical protein